MNLLFKALTISLFPEQVIGNFYLTPFGEAYIENHDPYTNQITRFEVYAWSVAPVYE